MLYAEVGARPEGDAYIIDGWPRVISKRAFNILVNAENHTSALRAIALKIGGQGAYARAASLIEAIKLRHPQISRIAGSSTRMPASACNGVMPIWLKVVMRRVVRLGIVVLPIHDSFITAARHEATLGEAMNIAWEEMLRRPKRYSFQCRTA